MPEVGPFKGLLFDPAVAGELDALTAPPYDVIGAEELDRFRARSPFNITWVDLGEGPDDPKPKYTQAGRLFRRWRDEGVLAPVGPAVYPYEMAFPLEGEARILRGVILEVRLEDWGGGILPHERTMPGPVEDRLAQMRATGANLSPIYALARGVQAQAELLDRVTARNADREVVDEDGVSHRLWVEPDAGALTAAYEDRDVLIADGHHRYQTSLVLQDELRRASGPGPWDAVMMFIVDVAAEDPPVLPYHRLVRVHPIPKLDGDPAHDLNDLLVRLRDDGMRFGVAVRTETGVLYLVGSPGGDPPAVRALHEQVLDPMPGVTDIAFVKDANAADRAVRAGEADLALFLPPAKARDIQQAGEARERLPEKSTYFWPKLRTGLVIRPFAQG